MEENNNQLDPNLEAPKAPKYPFSLESHWQPWYDDRRDYNTNAPTYYDYLANFNGLYKSIVELLNRVARRNIKVEDTNCINFTKINDWIDEGADCKNWHDLITLKCEVILSTYQKALNFDGNQFTLNNIISCLNDGLYSPDYLPLLNHLKDKLNQEIEDRKNADNVLRNDLNQEIQNRIDGDNNLRNYINSEVNNINDRLNTITSNLETLTNRVNSLQGSIQKIVTNLYEAGNATSNDINNYQINNHIASGNINLYGGTADGATLIKTHNGQAENDVTIGAGGAS